jgi:LPXTG-motif cell wall-anchored protein
MLSTRFFSLACAVAVFVCLMAAPVSAQPLDKRTLFTFSGPVTLPGVTLPAGQYLFRLADPNSSAKVVQVLNADGTRHYGLFFTLPAERLQPASTPEVRFMETASGKPPAIKTWWYPGEVRGYEFIFPKEQARQLAMSASQPVLTTQARTTTTEQTNTGDLSRVGASGQETSVSASAAPNAATPTGTTQEGQIASSSLSIATPSMPGAASASITTSAASTQTSSAQSGSTQARRTQLPRTSSQVPLIAMLGTVTLFSGASLGIWRRRQR